MQQIKISPRLGFTDGILPPNEIADALVSANVAKTEAPLATTLALSILGGGFIALGGAFFTATMVGSDLGLGTNRLIGGLVFSLGLVLVVIAGGELFTGNALMMLAYWRKRLTGRSMLRNLALVLGGNAIGALGVAALMAGSGFFEGPQGALARSFAQARFEMAPETAFMRGVLCNMLVCLAVWMSYSSRTPVGKIACVFLPVGGFITIGGEHSIANLYTIPAGMMAGAQGGIGDLIVNVGVVGAGNFVGAAIVAALYACALPAAPVEEAAPARTAAAARTTSRQRAADPAVAASERAERAVVEA